MSTGDIPRTLIVTLHYTQQQINKKVQYFNFRMQVLFINYEKAYIKTSYGTSS